ncbi:hypothetical protein FRC15_003528, partial [Serendipita sp. 397]
MSMPQDPITKIETAKKKKEIADTAFKTGDLQTALLSYHEAVMYLHGIDKNMLSAMSGAMGGARAPPLPDEETVETPGVQKEKDAQDQKELTEVDDLLSKIYSNQSACHMKKGNWKRALETAEKALSKNEKNYKAQFRKGKAQGELGYVEKALATLEDLLQKDDSGMATTEVQSSSDYPWWVHVDKAGISAEIARIKVADKEREKKHNQKFKGFLNRKPVNSYESVSSTPSHASSTSIQSTDSSVSAASTV